MDLEVQGHVLSPGGWGPWPCEKARVCETGGQRSQGKTGCKRQEEGTRHLSQLHLDFPQE